MISQLSVQHRRTLATRCGVNEIYLWQLLTGRKIASPKLVIQLERESLGALTRQTLRPKDYWDIWPDLEKPKDPVT